jgi:transcriptional regulator with XRE-family HTH domain
VGEGPLVIPWLRYIAANVRRLRAGRGLTQEGLADRAGVAPRYVQELENARTNLTLAMLVQIADALEVDPRRLLRPTAPLPPSRPGRPPKRAARPRGVR